MSSYNCQLTCSIFRAMTVKEPMDRMNNEKMREKKERGDRGEREEEEQLLENGISLSSLASSHRRRLS